jgi:hypothetical protein
LAVPPETRLGSSFSTALPRMPSRVPDRQIAEKSRRFKNVQKKFQIILVGGTE